MATPCVAVSNVIVDKSESKAIDDTLKGTAETSSEEVPTPSAIPEDGALNGSVDVVGDTSGCVEAIPIVIDNKSDIEAKGGWEAQDSHSTHEDGCKAVSLRYWCPECLGDLQVGAFAPTGHRPSVCHQCKIQWEINDIVMTANSDSCGVTTNMLSKSAKRKARRARC